MGRQKGEDDGVWRDRMRGGGIDIARSNPCEVMATADNGDNLGSVVYRHVYALQKTSTIERNKTSKESLENPLLSKTSG